MPPMLAHTGPIGAFRTLGYCARAGLRRCVPLRTNRPATTHSSAGRAIFAKTGAQSQSGLLMLLATVTLVHCRDDINEIEGKNE